jgi:putative molybdopterin biosynthesis protein
MAGLSIEYLTTRELADLLRIKERKVYELAAAGEIPCSRAMGKLLFPRHAVNAWLAGKSSGFMPATGVVRPNVFLGSHDPLLEWALRDSRAGLATFFDGSLDGLDRFARGEGVATGLHVFAPDADVWNVPLVQARFAREPVVLVEWAWRDRGLIIAPNETGQIEGINDLAGRRVVPRQSEAGSQRLLEHLLDRAGFAPGAVEFTATARTETDAALAVLDGKADAAFGLFALARQCRLGFVPVIRERFDLLLDRRSWFEEPMQTLMHFCRSNPFLTKAGELGGYDVSGLGRVLFNGS